MHHYHHHYHHHQRHYYPPPLLKRHRCTYDQRPATHHLTEGRERLSCISCLRRISVWFLSFDVSNCLSIYLSISLFAFFSFVFLSLSFSLSFTLHLSIYLLHPYPSPVCVTMTHTHPHGDASLATWTPGWTDRPLPREEPWPGATS